MLKLKMSRIKNVYCVLNGNIASWFHFQAQNKASGKQAGQGRLLPKEATVLLKRYPNLSGEL